jgi:hypothetical protein
MRGDQVSKIRGGDGLSEISLFSLRKQYHVWSPTLENKSDHNACVGINTSLSDVFTSIALHCLHFYRKPLGKASWSSVAARAWQIDTENEQMS